MYCMSVGRVSVSYPPDISDQFNEDFKDFLNKLVDTTCFSTCTPQYVVHIQCIHVYNLTILVSPPLQVSDQ